MAIAGIANTLVWQHTVKADKDHPSPKAKRICKAGQAAEDGCPEFAILLLCL